MQFAIICVVESDALPATVIASSGLFIQQESTLILIVLVLVIFLRPCDQML